ncbi:MAG TPA: DUF1638 domain-containing protein [Desulfobacteria bacterium]|nr:DUF1638 domain-containing protein [Desulfobacteria bacterium]
MNSVRIIIACEAFKGELEYFKNSINADIFWLEHSLHNVPAELNMKIKEKIKIAEDKLEPGSTVLLFFGNCGGALDGIQSATLNVVYPDVHDCIPILIGSMERFYKLHTERPGNFYLNRAWIDSGNGPLGSLNQYKERYGDEKGLRVTKKMYKNYTHFTLIDNGCYELDYYRKHVQEACEIFEKAYSEEKGSLDLVNAVLNNRFQMRSIPAGNSSK